MICKMMKLNNQGKVKYRKHKRYSLNSGMYIAGNYYCWHIYLKRNLRNMVKYNLYNRLEKNYNLNRGLYKGHSFHLLKQYYLDKLKHKNFEKKTVDLGKLYNCLLFLNKLNIMCCILLYFLKY